MFTTTLPGSSFCFTFSIFALNFHPEKLSAGPAADLYVYGSHMGRDDGPSREFLLFTPSKSSGSNKFIYFMYARDRNASREKCECCASVHYMLVNDGCRWLRMVSAVNNNQMNKADFSMSNPILFRQKGCSSAAVATSSSAVSRTSRKRKISSGFVSIYYAMFSALLLQPDIRLPVNIAHTEANSTRLLSVVAFFCANLKFLLISSHAKKHQITEKNPNPFMLGFADKRRSEKVFTRSQKCKPNW